MITVNKKVKKAVVAVLSLILLGGAIAGIATAKSHAAGKKSQRKQALQAVPAAGTYAKAPKIEDVEYESTMQSFVCRPRLNGNMQHTVPYLKKKTTTKV